MTVTRWALTPGYWRSPGLDPVAATAAGAGYAPKPTAQNTGPAAGVTLTTHTGDYTLSSGSISGLHITGNLILAGSNVSATDCQVDGAIFPNGGSSGHYPVLTNQTLTRVEATECYSTGASGLTFDACHFGGITSTFMQLTVYTYQGNVMTCSGVTIKNCLFDNLVKSTGIKHIEALHLMTVTDSLIQNNVFSLVAPADGYAATKSQITAAVTVENYQGNCDNITFDHNWLIGGGVYQIYWNPTNSTLTNNIFDTATDGQSLCPTDYNPANSFTQSGNTNNGSAVTVNNGSLS